MFGQVALNFAEARLLAAPVLPNLLFARPGASPAVIAVIGSRLMFLVLWRSMPRREFRLSRQKCASRANDEQKIRCTFPVNRSAHRTTLRLRPIS